MSIRKQNDEDIRVYDLTGYEVTFLHIDHRFSFDCSSDHRRNGHLRVVILVPFVLYDGERHRRIDPEMAATVRNALNILHKPLKSLVAYRAGLLIVDFVDDMRLEVEPRGPYESWEATGTGDVSDIKLLCDGGTPLWPGS